MKKIITLFSLFLSTGMMAQSPVTFVTSIGGTASEYGNSIVQTADSGFVIAGTSFVGSSSDLLLARLDKNGTIVWQKKYGGLANEEGYSIAVLPWGGLLISGYTTSYGPGGDVMLIKADANGDTLWTRAYGTSGADYGKVVEVTAGGNYRVTGVFFAGGTNKPGILTVDSNGVFISSKFVYNQFASPNYHAHYLRDNVIGITGASEMMIFTDSTGAYTGMLNYANSGYSMDACYLPNGTYASVFQADYGNNVNAGLFIADTNGVKLWSKKFVSNEDDIPMWVKPDGHGRILMAIMQRNPGTYYSKMVLMDIDYSGTIVWQKIYTMSVDQQMGDVVPTLDGGYAMVGSYTVNGSFSNYNLVVFKTDSLGNSGCKFAVATNTSAAAVDNTPSLVPTPFTSTMANTGTSVKPANAVTTFLTTVQCSSVSTGIDVVGANESSILWPNPATSVLHIAVPAGRNLTFRILSVSGAILSEGRLMPDGIINVTGLSNGFYVVQTFDGGQLKSAGKFVKN
jgi:hypothetical protein